MLGDVRELPLTIVPIQLASLLQRIRSAGLRLPAQVPHRAIRDEQVEPAIEVIVHEARAESGETKLEQTALSGAVLVEALAEIEIERVALVVEVRDEQILVAVAIDVGEVDAHAALRLTVAVHRHARQQGLVFERP